MNYANEYNQGAIAFESGDKITDCPYSKITSIIPYHDDRVFWWKEGYRAAQNANNEEIEFGNTPHDE